MNAEPVTVRRLGVVLAVTVALLTSACAAGQQAQTANEKPTLDGTNADLGSLNLRAVVIEAPMGARPYYPAGSDVPLKIVIVNSGRERDRLLSITSPAVTSWGSFKSTADAQAVIDADSASTAPRTPKASGSESPGASASGLGAASQPPPSPATSVALPPQRRVSWGTPDAKGALLLMGTTEQLYPGTTVAMTFSFQRAGTITVQVPVALSDSPHSSVIPAPSGTGVEG